MTRERQKPYRTLQWAFWKPTEPYSKENKTLQKLTHTSARLLSPYMIPGHLQNYAREALVSYMS